MSSACLSLFLCMLLLVPYRIGADGPIFSSYSELAKDNPAAFLSALASMPDAEQNAFLLAIGASLQRSARADCNIFGGANSCKTYPSDSPFAQTCELPADRLKVDCVNYADAIQNDSINPDASLRQYLGPDMTAQLIAQCPQCFDNLRIMWCNQHVQKCGSFQKYVQKALFPAMKQVLESEQAGKTKLEALALAMPLISQASAKSMVCREMCDAVVDTCSCADERRTFGQSFDMALDHPALPGFVGAAPLDVPRMVFSGIWDTPLCDLFLPKDHPEFDGHCETLPRTCSNEQGWCSQANETAKVYTESLIALELARSIFGFAGNPSVGLFQQIGTLQDEAGDTQNTDIQALEKQYIKTGGVSAPPTHHQRHGTNGVLVFVILVVCFSSVAVGLYGLWWWQQKRVKPPVANPPYTVLSGDVF